ncbi:MAG: VWA domain-containing protein [Kiritimatiellia bacterium]
MSFVHPALLYALALGAIPIIIYYLMRFRSLKVPWGANYVLERALERLKKHLYLEQIILIALRVLALAALVTAFARPITRAATAALTGTGVHRVLLVDGSYSMLAGEGKKTQWRKAGEVMNKLTATWGRGEKWSLCLAGRAPRWIVGDAPVESAEQSAEIIESLEPEETGISLAAALEEVLNRVGGRKTEIYIVGDDQAVSWRGMDKVEIPAGGDLTFYWVNVSTADRENAAVTRVEVSHERVLAGHPCRVFVRVKNFAETPVEDLEVDIMAGGRHASKKRLSLLPGQEAWAHADIRFEETGSHYVSGRLADDVLPYDNTMSAGLEVTDGLSVLVIRDPAKSGKFDSSFGFLQLMAQVSERMEQSGGTYSRRARFEVLPPCPPDCPGEKMREADIVIVDGGSSLSASLAEKLHGFVRSGGCVLLAPDDTVNSGSWNDILAGSGIMPARLGPLHVEPLGGEEFQQLSRSGFKTAPLRSFETMDDGDITAVRFYSWFELREPAEDCGVLASFNDGSPFALVREQGIGSVILLAAGLNCRNNSLIVRETGYALAARVLMAGHSAGIYPRTVATGVPVKLRLKEEKAPAGVQFDTGGGESRSMNVENTSWGPVATLPGGADRSGHASVLVVRTDGHERFWYGIQGARTDSDLAPMQADLKTRVVEKLELAEAASWDELNTILASSRRGRERYGWVMGVLLALLLGEMAMQRRFV